MNMNSKRKAIFNSTHVNVFIFIDRALRYISSQLRAERSPPRNGRSIPRVECSTGLSRVRGPASAISAARRHDVLTGGVCALVRHPRQRVEGGATMRVAAAVT